ncbi:MAG: sulfate adenylyltransferase subunit CysN [Candidatus Acidiferrum sp.]
MALANSIEPRTEFDRFLELNLHKQLLRFITAGSVDDGKSTLIGRLLHDSKTVYEDQLASVRKSRINRSSGPLDFSLITDGLRAEREQGITIDVGYRYFSTARRKFIIADTPGHEQYTRNMATGASTADLAVILIDATKGLLPQTLRHTYISSLLGISCVVAAINKMDLVEDQEKRFSSLEKEFRALAEKLGIREVKCIPMSALAGDNVVDRGQRMIWYAGPTLLEHLETVPIPKPETSEGVRFPIQYVVRPDADFRGFAGQMAGGVLRPGDLLIALPSGQQSRVGSIVTYEGPLAEAFSPMSVTLELEDQIDLSRGDMLVSPASPPHISRRFRAAVVWMHAQPLEIGHLYLMKQCARQVRGRVTSIRHRININTFEAEATGQLYLNDIAVVDFETSNPLFFDSYQRNRITGSFIVIDPLTNATLGAGMIREDLQEETSAPKKRENRASEASIPPLERQLRRGHYPAVILINARPALARQLERALFEEGFDAMVVERKSSFLSARTAWETLHAAGFVVIYHNPSLGLEEKLDLRAAAGDYFFDIADLALPAGEAEVIEQMLSLAESLRIPADRRIPER